VFGALLGMFWLFDALYRFLFLLKLTIKLPSAVIVYYIGDKKMGISCTKPKTSSGDMLHPQIVEEYIAFLLRTLDAYHCKSLTLKDYLAMSMQDMQYSPNMTVSDKVNLLKLNELSMTQSRGDRRVGDYLECADNILSLAKQCENNMMKVLNRDEDLKAWFMQYNPDHYMFKSHPNLRKLARLTDSDGHSGASFALCCKSVKRRMMI